MVNENAGADTIRNMKKKEFPHGLSFGWKKYEGELALVKKLVRQCAVDADNPFCFVIFLIALKNSKQCNRY